MPNSTVPAAAIGLPNRRLFLAAGSAGAVFGALSHALAAPAVSPELLDLIEAHRRGVTILESAFRREDEVFERFKAACQIFDFEGVAFDVHAPGRSKEFLLKRLEIEKLREVERFKIGSSAAMRRQLDEMFEDLYRDKIEHFDTIFAKVEEMRRSMGLVAAGQATIEAIDVSHEILLEICAFPCASSEDARVKAEYLIERMDEIDGDFLKALLASLAGRPLEA